MAVANEILVKENVRGIKLDKLCPGLGVTKGSFYWHFKTRGDLLEAMLAGWRKRMTLNIIQTATRRGGTTIDRLRRLLMLPRHGRARSAAAVEQSMRDWSRRNERPRAAVREVDELRLNYFEQLFRERGLRTAEAGRRAYLTYCMVMGDSILHDTVPHTLSNNDYVDTAVGLLTEGAEPGTSGPRSLEKASAF
jgi:AcrR family transcriptional regulator